MMNSLSYLNATEEQLPMLKRIVDICRQAEKFHEVVHTEFLSPDICFYVPQLLNQFHDLNYTLDGGYDEAEYARLVVYPDYLSDVSVELFVLEITYHPKFGSMSHRDVLGAVLGLGLKRQVIGDILLEEGKVHVLTTESMGEFLMQHLDKIGRVAVKTSSVSIAELIKKVTPHQLIFATVKQLRLDAIIASGYHLSRSKAVQLIQSEKVKVNHQYTKDNSKELKTGDLISVKGFGRIKLNQVNGISKKERIKVEIKKYV